MFTLDELIAALYDTGLVPYADAPITEGNTALIRLCSSPTFSTFVTIIIERSKVFLLKNLMYLPVANNTASVLVLHQQANMQLEYVGCPGRICLDNDEGDMFALMYSLVVPAESLDATSVATLITSACGAIEMLSSTFEAVEEKVVDGVLSVEAAFLVPIGQTEDIKVSIHPAMQLMLLNQNQRSELSAFLRKNNIALEELLQMKKLDIFAVVTDECEICLSNGSTCWQIQKYPLPKNFRMVDLESLILPSYKVYRSACTLSGMPSKPFADFFFDVSLSLY